MAQTSILVMERFVVTMEPYKLISIPSHASVQMGLLDRDVNQILMNVPLIHVKMVEHVRMVSIPTHVNVQIGPLGTDVKQVTKIRIRDNVDECLGVICQKGGSRNYHELYIH